MASLVTNVGLDDAATGSLTGTVGEPSVAASGRKLLVTGNWFSSFSADRGATWQLVNPFTEFPQDVGEFCCDQLVHYSSTHRRWIWLLQYSVRGTSNVIRFATSRTGAPGSWSYFDLRPQDVKPSWTSVWFDYPHLAQSAEHLFFSTNVFDTSDRWVGAAVVRYSLDDLAAGGAVDRKDWTTTSVGSLRFVQGAGDAMWFASHNPSSHAIRLHLWEDSSTSVEAWNVPIAAWNDGPYSSRGPGGGEWLNRVDSRITGAARANGLLSFAWTASPISGRPNPYVRVVRIEEDTLAVRDEPDLWSATGAWAYPAISANKNGRLAMAAFFGGPSHPAHAVGWLGTGAAPAWAMTTTATSTHPPSQGKWGDYITCHRHPSSSTTCMASGFTLQGGTDRRAVEPRVVIFRP